MNTMKPPWWVQAGALWIVALLLAFAIVFGAARGLAAWLGIDQATTDAAVIATFTGVAGAVPVALLLGWLANRAAQQGEAAARLERRTRLLRTIKTDLCENLAELLGRDRSQAVIPFLRTDVWQALSVGDELELVNDPELLNVLARAYHRIATTADLERQIWAAFHDPAHWTRRIEVGSGKDVTAKFRQSLEVAVRDQDPHAKAAIDVALESLYRELGPSEDRCNPLRQQ